MLLVSNTDAKVSRSCTNHMTRPALMSGHSASLTGPCRGTRGGKTERDSSAARKNGFYRYEYTNAHSHAYAPKYCANVRGASQVWKSISLSIGACKRVNQKIEHTVAKCHDCLARRACTFYSLFFLKISHFHFFKNKVERFKLSGFPVSPVTPVTQDWLTLYLLIFHSISYHICSCHWRERESQGLSHNSRKREKLY
jgi:hypothetical protein